MKKMILGALAITSISTFAQVNSNFESDLNTATIELSQDTYERLNGTLENLNQAAEGIDVSEDLIGVPDYKPTYYKLQKKISESLTYFTEDMDNLYLKIQKDLKRVVAIERLGVNSEYLNEGFQKEIQKTYERIGSYINADYQIAIKRLYTLNSYLDLPVKRIRNGYVDLFKNRQRGAGLAQLEKMCFTSVCINKISQDLSAWMSLVDTMNRDIEIAPKEKITFTDRASQVSSINHFSTAINDFTRSLIKVGLKPNTTYTASGAAATYIGQVATTGLGIGVALVTFPAKLINNVFRGIKNLNLTKKFLVKDLTLKKLDTYDADSASKDLQRYASEAKTRIFMTIGKKEYEAVLKNALGMLDQSEKNYIIENVLDEDLTFKESIDFYYPDFFNVASESTVGTDLLLKDCGYEVLFIVNRNPVKPIGKTMVVKSVNSDLEYRIFEQNTIVYIEGIEKSSASEASYGTLDSSRDDSSRLDYFKYLYPAMESCENITNYKF